MSPEHQKLLTDFAMALVSGTAAGLVAGLILMWRQFGMELAKDDSFRILGILHEIENADIELNDAFFNATYGQYDRGSTNLERKLSVKTEAAMDVLFKIGTQAQYIRAKKYKLLRAYLVLRTKRGINFDWNEIELMRNLKEFAQDINEYIINRRSILNWLKWKWRFVREFSHEQKTILANATTWRDGQHWWVLLCVNKDKLSSVEVERGINRANDLVGRGLLSKDEDNYQLTREGWKVAVRILKGKYDMKAGVTIDLV